LTSENNYLSHDTRRFRNDTTLTYKRFTPLNPRGVLQNQPLTAMYGNSSCFF